MKDWTWSQKDFKNVLNLIPRDLKIRRTDKYFWPASVHYFSELNPTFIYQVPEVSLFSLAPTWLIRDGLISVVWFFLKNPIPPAGWKSQLYVHAKFAAFVPPAWREFVGTYTIRAQTHPCQEVHTLLLVGLITNFYCSMASLEQQLKLLKNKLGPKNLRNVRIVSFLHEKHNAYRGASELNFHFHYIRMLSQHLGNDITSLSWNQFFEKDSFEGITVVDLNDRLTCADSYFVQHVLNRGGGLPGTTSKKGKTKNLISSYFPVSPYHGFEIVQKIADAPWADSEWQALQFILELEARVDQIGFPPEQKKKLFLWPYSMMDWAHSLPHSFIDSGMRGQ